MARGIDFPGANTRLTAPIGREGDVQPLHCFRNGACIVSCWELSSEELAEVIANGGKLFLSIWGRDAHPPVLIGTEENVREVVADYGPLWKRD